MQGEATRPYIIEKYVKKCLKYNKINFHRRE
jgi:hypothetical protein